MLYIIIEIPQVNNLMVADQCTTIRASWDITEGSCTDLSYNVTLLSSDGVILQGPFTTSITVYNFTNVEIFNGIFNVSVVPINGNARGASITETAVINVSPDGKFIIPGISPIHTYICTYTSSAFVCCVCMCVCACARACVYDIE